MQKKIGNVVLDYSFYEGVEQYSDGEIEDVLLEAFQTGRQKELLYNSSAWPVLYHVSDIRENILEWYPFKENAEILEIGSGCGAITGLLSRKGKAVTCVELSERRSLINAYRNADAENITIIIGNLQKISINKKFDYITMIGVWEYSGAYIDGENPYLEMLELLKGYLKQDGKIIVAIENKVGLKYWNGAPEDHTWKLYSGLNDYINDKTVRTFSRMEIERVLKKAGLSEFSFYYPMPDYKLPECIYSDKILPKAGEIRTYKKNYDVSRLYTFYDATSYDQICSDDIFAYFANSFLFVCGEKKQTVCFARYNRTRKREFRIATRIIEKNGQKHVVKEALNRQAQAHILQIKENELSWINALPKLNYVQGQIKDGCYETPYIDGINLDVCFYEWRNNYSKFVEETKKLISEYLLPSEEEFLPFQMTEQFKKVFGELVPLNSKCLKVSNVDLIFSNLKLLNNKVYNFDYEWIFNFPIPFEYILWRAASNLYLKYAIYLRRNISEVKFLEEVGISSTNFSAFRSMEKNFQEYVCGVRNCENYLANYQKGVIDISVQSWNL